MEAHPSSAAVSSGQADDEWVAQQVEAMVSAWKRGEQPSAGEILARHPGLGDEASIRLIYEEVCLRRESGQEVRTAEVVRRFPRWASELEVLLGYDRLMRPPVIDFPRVGEHLGDFQLLEVLGRGTAGLTFLAAQPLLADRPVVLKVTTLDHDEHLSLARLQHTYIVPLYSEQVFPDRGLRALCMPYLGGASLAEILEAVADLPPEQRTGRDVLEALERSQSVRLESLPATGPFRTYLEQSSYIQAVCWIAACLADALQYAHDRGLVHMDLKPSNVLISSDGQPMLLDFHLARGPVQPGGARPERLGGTPGWMSPEQRAAMSAVAEGREVPSTVDGRSDLYSLGLLLHEALGGARGKGEQDARPRLEACNPAISVGLADIVHRCLAPQPRDRYRSAAALADDLRRHLNDLPLRGVPNRSLRERWRKWRRRRPYALAFGAARVLTLAALLSVVALVWWSYHQRIRELQSALADAQRFAAEGRYDDAFQTAENGLRLARRTPAAGSFTPAFEQQRQLARKGQKARELHDLADLIRFSYGVSSPSRDELNWLAGRCQAVWKQRDLLMNGDSGTLPADVERGIQNDLLELALIAADLRVRLASSVADEALAHGDAVRQLDEALAAFGPSPSLVRERRIHAAAIGLRGVAQTPEPQPSTAWEHYDLGRSYLRSGRVKEAAEEFQRSLELRSQGFWPNFYQGLCAYRLGQFGEAVAAFRACLTISPQSAECYYNRALAYEALGQLDDARRDYSRSIALAPGMPGAYLNRGILDYRAGRFDTAIADYQRALDTTASREMRGRVYYNLALAHLGRGDRVSAELARRKAIELGSRDAPSLPDAPGPAH